MKILKESVKGKPTEITHEHKLPDKFVLTAEKDGKVGFNFVNKGTFIMGPTGKIQTVEGSIMKLKEEK